MDQQIRGQAYLAPELDDLGTLGQMTQAVAATGPEDGASKQAQPEHDSSAPAQP